MKRIINFFKRLFSKKEVKKIKLSNQLYLLMKDGKAFRISELCKITKRNKSSVSSAIRDFRKEANGSNLLLKKRVGKVYQYSLVINPLSNILEKRNRKNK